MTEHELSELVKRYKNEIRDLEREELLIESSIIGAQNTSRIYAYDIKYRAIRQHRVAKQQILYALEAVLDDRLDRL